MVDVLHILEVGDAWRQATHRAYRLEVDSYNMTNRVASDPLPPWERVGFDDVR